MRQTRLAVVLSIVLSSTLHAEFIPFQISLVPGLGFPFGEGDVGLSLGTIGAIAGDVRGVQASGIFSIARSVQGAQLAGIFNIAGSSDGIQAAGIFNITGEATHGAQLAGLFNIAGSSIDGLQYGGIFSMAGGSVRGAQVGGIFAMAKNLEGLVQAGGIFAKADRVNGAQLGGLFTQAESVRGMQMAGLWNAAGLVEGVQVGFVNVAGELHGIQVGLVNIAGNAINGIGSLREYSSNYDWLYWQSGTPSLYMIIFAGEPDGSAWSSPDGLVVSGGIGTRFGGREAWLRPYVDLELAASADVSGTLRSVVSLPTQSLWDGVALSRIGENRPRAVWPTLRIGFGVPILWRLHAVAGLRVDFSLPGMPEPAAALQTGLDIQAPAFLGSFVGYAKPYAGLRF